MNRYLIKILLSVIVLLVGCCSFPNDQEVKNTFYKLAAIRVPPDISLSVVSTYRGDGDNESFSQVVIFNAVPKNDIIIKQGWLSGITFKKGVPKKNGRVELIYQRSKEQWILTVDGLTVPPI